MSCEKQSGHFYNLSLIDGSIEEVHFKPLKEILASIPKLSKAEPKLTDSETKSLFVPFLTEVNMTGL